ncbi:hypothetical protein K435DRAFT_810085 [Dendrothele bispora CBS 962.96]|uniref:Uncharacterized protein n=1 Tax=Dendrothele bispora (strain CBS 962.96) TaxID=1314807 RepID=A0A4V4HBP2_DENBC|nr:hypothetical protein K435DRAFT_810085 [Dendrothele bispora CBS 962.96]
MSTVSTNANNKNAGDDNQPTINDIPSLRNGIIKTVKSTGKVEFTILVVGETGVGKSSYADLSLSGSFSGQVEKAVKMLEQNHKAMEEKGVDKSTLDKVQNSLDEMKRKLDLLKKAQKESEEGIIRRVFNTVTGRS